MDILTHALTGALAADALPFTGRLGKGAPIAATVAAAAPDLDLLPAIIARFPPSSLNSLDALDPGLVMRFHRSYTHSFFYTALASVILGLIARRWSRKGAGWQWTILFCLAFFSHIFWDLANPWGVRAWLPFSNAKSAWDLLPLTDPFILAVLAAVFVANHALTPKARDAAVRPRYVAWIGLCGGVLVTARFFIAMA